MTDFNSELRIIEDFSTNLEKNLSIKLIISEYIQENDIFLNKDFFVNIENVNDKYINNILNNVSKKLEEFKKIKINLKNNENISEIERKFLLQVLNRRWFELIKLQNSIFFEAEKAWYKLNEYKRNKYIRNVNLIERILYWKKVSDNPWEVDLVFNKLFSSYKKNWARLNEEEREKFSFFFSDFNKSLKNYSLTEKKEKKEKKENIDNEILKNDISIEKVQRIFDLVIELYWLDWWKTEIGNYLVFWVSTDDKIIKIPKNKKNITIKKLLELIDHEIWVHAIRWYNTNNTLKSYYLHYAEAEEWFAKLSNSLFNKNLDELDVDAGIALISTFIAENYDWEKTNELLKIYFKLSLKKELSEEEIEKKAKDRMLRVKKHYSLKEKWAYLKDASYYRWEKQIIELLLNEKDIKWFLKKFYFSKLAIKDLENVKQFKEKLDINEDELIYPLWIWKILYKKLIWERITLEELRNWDPRFEAIDWISIDVKRKIIEILNMILK